MKKQSQLEQLNIYIESLEPQIEETLLYLFNKEVFHQEKDELSKAGLGTESYGQIDETSARVNGKNYHTHIISNPFFTAYHTTEKKNQLSALSALRTNKKLYN